MSEDRNCLSWWFPRLQAAGVSVPRTEVVRTAVDLMPLCDGRMPDDQCAYASFMEELRRAAERIGTGPWFLRTGQGSGKHYWRHTCFVENLNRLAHHVAALVEWSHMVDVMGLPHDVWAVREMLQTTPLCGLTAYGGMPLVREFRLFVRDGVVDHVQPYWPQDAVEQGRPDAADWRERLQAASVLAPDEEAHLEDLSERVGRTIPGYWSLDWLQTADGRWYATDMALGEQSFRYGGRADGP